MTLKIVHIIERFSSAGPERSLIAAAKYAAISGLQQEHTVCTLEKSGSPVAVVMARQAGVQVLLGPDAARRAELLAQADIVLIHFWNNPALYEFLRGPLPPMRLAVWLKIFGGHPPQIIPRDLLDFADGVAVTTPGTLHLPQFSGREGTTPVIYGLADFSRLEGFSPRPHADFTIGIIAGSLERTKLHPDFVSMSAAARIPNARFLVCGGGGEALRQEAQALGVAHRFDFRGYVENIRSVLAGCDIFGYPLAADTYATSEKALQEAMWVGVPPVVFPHAGVRYLVEDGVTGRVVETPAAYTQAIEELCRNPAERRRLGENARIYARAAFDPQRAVTALAALCDQLLQRPKRERIWPDDGDTPAAWFVAALGEHGAPFARSMQDADATAEAEIAASSALLSRGEGGIIHYRNAYPDDPYLRHWTHLITAAETEDHRSGLQRWRNGQKDS